jgi:hypothetical protein
MEVHELAAQLEKFANETKRDLSVIKRGVYGDPENKVKGLIERQDSDEERIGKIEKRQWKIGVLMAGGVAMVDFVIIYVKEFLK